MADEQGSGKRMESPHAQDQERRDQAIPEGDRSEEKPRKTDRAADQSVFTPGGNLRYRGGSQQGVPMEPDDEAKPMGRKT
jgi:hypothetical protein